jgi:hypothetical protein
MEYEEIVAAIAHIDAAKNIMGLRCPDNVTDDTYCALNDAKNELNRTRLEMLGGGQGRPYHVADLNLAGD